MCGRVQGMGAWQALAATQDMPRAPSHPPPSSVSVLPIHRDLTIVCVIHGNLPHLRHGHVVHIPAQAVGQALSTAVVHVLLMHEAAVHESACVGNLQRRGDGGQLLVPVLLEDGQL